MTTEHISLHELEQLENNAKTGHISLLVVGTFNAKIIGNDVTWYYERPQNEFWFLFPKMLGFDSLHVLDNPLSNKEIIQARKDFCNDHKIVIVDIFKRVRRKLTGHSDSLLEKLKKEDYEAFDYKKAFEKVKIELVCFTWAGKLLSYKNSYITKNHLKQNWTNWFSSRNSKILNLESPSRQNTNKFPSRFDKLQQWKSEYEKAKE